MEGLRPNQPCRDEVDPADHTHGWQFFAAQRVEHHFRAETVWPRLAPTEQAVLRSQSGPMSGVAFSAVPSSPPTRLAPQLFRVLLLCRLAPPPSHFSHMPVWPTTRGHHPAACPRAGVLGSRGFSVESAVARVCREAGARVFHISLSGIWTCLLLLTMLVGWRWSRMACLSLGGPVGHRRHSRVPRCVQMEPWQKLTVQSIGRILSSLGPTAARDWSCWQLKSAADGRRRPGPS